MSRVFEVLCVVAGASASVGKGAREPLEVKLIGGSQYSGRLAVKVGDTWGTVCDTEREWDDEDAEIACRSLGLEGGYLHEANFDLYPLPTDADYPVMIADVYCVGNETFLDECHYEHRADPGCVHDDDVVLTCEPSDATSTVRLIGGDGASGRLVVKYVGTWGTVCEDAIDAFDVDELDTDAAEVVCRELGLSGGRRGSQGVNGSFLFPWPAGVFYSTIWPEIISCDGDEQKLEECSQDSWGNHSCDHSKDVYIFCDVPIETPDLTDSQFVLDIGFGYSASKCATVNSTEHPDGYHCDRVLTSNPDLPRDFTISYKGADQVCVQRADGGKAWDGQWVRLVCSSGCGRGGSGPSSCGGGPLLAADAMFAGTNAEVWNSPVVTAAAIVLCLCAALLALRAKQARSKARLVGSDPCGSPTKTLLVLQRRPSISKDLKSELV